MNSSAIGPAGTHRSLRRSLTLLTLLFYGLAVIVGAGIYVAIASVIDRAGDATPLSFLLAGIVAGLTGLCYAELASRFPEASGAAAYVMHGFGSNRLAQLTALALTVAIAIAAASIASGSVSYLSKLIGLSATALTTLLVVGFTMLAMLGVRESASLSAAIGVLEILGIAVATWVGFLTAPDLNVEGMLPSSVAGWQGVVGGSFIAFFAFIGFESLVNMAEEAKEPRRTIPYAIVGAIVVSTLLYIAVSAALVLADRGGESPLIGLFQGSHASLFAAVGSLAIANGVLVEIMMLARLFYGMARRRQLPTFLEQVNPRTRTPIVATALAGAIVLAASVLIPFKQLVGFANTLTLGIFVLVDLALWRIQNTRPTGERAFAVARWVPPVAAASAVALIFANLFA
ncbi:MAG: amino acid permease [Xanthobacteraceae bacterium]|nr:amino acid permease [Xanthobacteraceae bacterium]